MAEKVRADFPELRVENLPIGSLKPAKDNARTHSKKQIGELAESMNRLGVSSPIVVDAENEIIAGHGRLMAFRLLKYSHVPVIRLSHLNSTQARALRIADNKLPSKAGWDLEILSSELASLQIELPKVGLDLAITGFEISELDTILGDLTAEAKAPVEELPELQAVMVARMGDLFSLGNHKLLMGDARKAEDHARLMGGETGTMAFLDPPYNVPIQGHVGGRGSIKHREFACASGEMTSDQFVGFLEATCGHCANHLVDGGIVYISIDWRHILEMLTAGNKVFGQPKNVCVWNKTTPGQGTFYRSQYENIFVYKHGTAPHINSFELGQHGRTRTNVWTYPGANSFRAGRMDDLKLHPTVKPVALIADAMRDCSRRGSIVLDVFAGVGSTIIAAEQVGRRAFCMEIDALYVDAAIRRWQKMTGKDAISGAPARPLTN